MAKLRIWCWLVLLASGVALRAEGALFLFVPGMVGEVTDKDRVGSMRLVAASLGHELPSQPGEMTTRNHARALPLTISKEVDANSPLFAQLVATGTSLKDVKIESTMTTTQAGVQPFYRVKITNAVVIDYSVHMDDEGRPMEEFKLLYETISWIAHKPDGKPSGATCWDFIGNKPCAPTF